MATDPIPSCRTPYKRRSGTHRKSQAFKHGFADTRLERTFRNMKDRCYNPKAQNYRYYGAEGVTICDEWRASNAAFYQWAVRNGYRDDLFIDRIDNEKGYSPTNCRWVSGANGGPSQDSSAQTRGLEVRWRLQPYARWTSRSISALGLSHLRQRRRKLSVRRSTDSGRCSLSISQRVPMNVLSRNHPYSRGFCLESVLSRNVTSSSRVAAMFGSVFGARVTRIIPGSAYTLMQ